MRKSIKEGMEESVEYIALDKIDSAKRLIQKVFSSTDQLKHFPDSGRKPPELKDSRYREIIVDPCRIFHRVEKKKIYIIYVMRSERNLIKYLLDERSKKSS